VSGGADHLAEVPVNEGGTGLGSGRHATPDTPSDEHDPAPAEQEPVSVLVVEDEEPISEALAYIIEEAGFVPLVASHGKQALELVRLHHPALIITDLMMPLMDGAEMIATLRADKDGLNPVPPIVLMTAGGMKRALEVGADEVLHKPFDVADVEDILDRYLGHRKR
jgi:two-component system, chemotaxis family, chemotaxis protein CheY